MISGDEREELKWTARYGARAPIALSRLSYDREREEVAWRRTWAELLRLVFEVKLTCPRCGTEMKILSFITETEPIRKILAYLKEKGIDALVGPFTDCAS